MSRMAERNEYKSVQLLCSDGSKYMTGKILLWMVEEVYGNF